MVHWRSVKSLWNRINKGYLLMCTAVLREEGILRESCRKQRVSLSRAVFMWTLFHELADNVPGENWKLNFSINCSMKGFLGKVAKTKIGGQDPLITMFCPDFERGSECSHLYEKEFHYQFWLDLKFATRGHQGVCLGLFQITIVWFWSLKPISGWDGGTSEC